jgi:hypothetical protein
MRSASNIEVGLDINGKSVAAVIDTAAQVTIILDKLYQSLSSKPTILKTVKLLTAGRDLSMNGFKVAPVSILIGSQAYTKDEIYVAPIDDDMLLGLDFLQEHKVVINMCTGNLEVGQEHIAMNTRSEKCTSESRVAQVTVLKNAKVPPCSVLRIPCSVSIPLSDYVIEPIKIDNCLDPRTLHTLDSIPLFCLVNMSDKFVNLKQGQVVGSAYEVCEILEQV